MALASQISCELSVLAASVVPNNDFTFIRQTWANQDHNTLCCRISSVLVLGERPCSFRFSKDPQRTNVKYHKSLLNCLGIFFNLCVVAAVHPNGNECSVHRAEHSTNCQGHTRRLPTYLQLARVVPMVRSIFYHSVLQPLLDEK